MCREWDWTGDGIGLDYLTKRFFTQNKIRRSDQKLRRFKKTFFSKTKDKLLLYFPKILVPIFQTSCREYFRTFGKKNELYNKTPPKRAFLAKIDLTATGLYGKTQCHCRAKTAAQSKLDVKARLFHATRLATGYGQSNVGHFCQVLSKEPENSEIFCLIWSKKAGYSTRYS